MKFNSKFNIDVLIMSLAFFGGQSFFVFSEILGYYYEGIDESNLFLFYSITVFLGVLCVFTFLLLKKKKYKEKEILIILFPIYLIIAFVFPLINYQYPSELELIWLRNSFVWALPAVYSALYLVISKKMTIFFKYLEVYALMYSIAVLKAIVLPFFFEYREVSIAGTNYQSSSYIASFAFGMTIYFLLFGKEHIRFSFTKNKFYKTLLFSLTISNLIGVIIPGGRGALVLAFGFIVFSLIFMKKKSNVIENWKFYLMIFFLAIGGVVFMGNPVFSLGMNRAIEFIGPNFSVNWEGTSGRDFVYNNAISFIEKRPMLGYGIFGYGRYLDYPHNLFLELLLGGGVILLLSAISFLIYIGLKLLKLIKCNPKYKLILFLSLPPFVTLMFSGTFLQNSMFWFIIIVVLAIPNHQRKGSTTEETY